MTLPFLWVSGIKGAYKGLLNGDILVGIKGSYDKAIKALECLQEHEINHSIGFALCKLNFHCIDHIVELCKKYECTMLNVELYQSFKKTRLIVRFTEWLKAKEYVSKYVKMHVKCVETGCVAQGFAE